MLMQWYRMSPLKWKRRRTFLIFAWSDREETSSTGTCRPFTLAVMSDRSWDSSSLWTRTTMTELSPSEIPNFLNASEICIREDSSYTYDTFLLRVYACALYALFFFSKYKFVFLTKIRISDEDNEMRFCELTLLLGDRLKIISEYRLLVFIFPVFCKWTALLAATSTWKGSTSCKWKPKWPSCFTLFTVLSIWYKTHDS